jgi:hypothetical protein
MGDNKSNAPTPEEGALYYRLGIEGPSFLCHCKVLFLFFIPSPSFSASVFCFDSPYLLSTNHQVAPFVQVEDCQFGDFFLLENSMLLDI